MMPFRISDKLKAIVMPYDQRIATTIPHAKAFSKAGKKYHLVPHRSSEVKLLSNLGYKAPAPILTQYDWCNTVPYRHQAITAGLLSTQPRAYVLNGLGSGKTRAAMFAADFLMKHGEATSALIVAPLSVLTGTWEYELFQIMPNRVARVLHGTKDKRLKELAQPADFYIINTDGINVILDELLDRDDIDLVIIDELAAFRNARTRRWKALKKVIRSRRWVWGMSGLPTPNGPTDAWGQARLLTPERVPKYFKQFQAKVEYQITQFKWAPRREANSIVAKALQPSVRFATDECIDLPPTTYSTRSTGLAQDQDKAYNQMLKHFYTLYQGQEITAANAGVKTAKLLQIACGFSYSDTGFVEYPDNPKVQIVKDIIDETEQKVLVFAPFKHAVDMLYKELSQSYSVAKVYGDTPKKQRDLLFAHFRNNPDPKVIVAHPGVLSHGLTLTEASVIVWYSPTMSYETYEQANARIVRPGQKHHTHVISIESCSMERYMFNRLAKKGSLSTVLLDMFNDMTKEKAL
jgi:SNF2 family DNA or RNA helicase